MIHKHTGRLMWQWSTLVIFWNWEKYSCHSKLVSTFLVLPSFPRNNSQDWWNSGGLQWTQVFRHISTALDADGQRTQRWSGWLFRAYRVNVLVSVPLEKVSVSQCPKGPDATAIGSAHTMSTESLLSRYAIGLNLKDFPLAKTRHSLWSYWVLISVSLVFLYT